MSASAIVREKDRVILTLTGPLTVERAASIKELFEQGLTQAGTGPLYLRIEEAREIDLSFIQVLVAAQKTAQANSTQILGHGSLSNLYDEYLQKFGFTDLSKSLLTQKE